ncbi:MAG: TOBE domain-containing protein [Paracoccaceae bacterium]
MNLIPGAVDAGFLRLAEGGARLPLPAGPALAEGRAVTLGIRPENLVLAEPGTPGAVAATVEVVELTGPEKLAHLRLGPHLLLASLPPLSRLEPGSVCHLTIDPAATVLFDSATGLRIDG